MSAAGHIRTFKRNGAKALGAFALSLSAIPCVAQTVEADPPAEEAPENHSVYVGRVISSEFVGYPPCPDGYICMSYVSEIVVEPIEVRDGNRDIGVQTYRIVQNHQRIGPPPISMRAERGADGNWKLISWNWLREEACFNLDTGKYELADRNSDICHFGRVTLPPDIAELEIEPLEVASTPTP